MTPDLGSELGRGAFGTVYAKRNDPTMCLKVSNKLKHQNSNACRQWSNEYKTIKTFMNRMNKRKNSTSLVRIVEPTKFDESDSMCYMELPRIYRPDGKDGPTLQAQLGVPSCQLIHKGRGEFIGLKEVRQFVKDEKDIERIAYELGLMIASIHFVGRNDAWDVEVFLGKEANTRKCRLYLADFDLSKEITEYDNATIERMVWSIEAVPYFPTRESSMKLFKLFKKGYFKVAARQDRLKEAYAVFEALENSL